MATQAAERVDADEEFRAEVKTFLAEHFPSELKGQSNALASVEGPTDESPAHKSWREAMGSRGWGTPTWPKEYGGGGLTRKQARILDEEMARVGAFNPIGGMGVMMFGPRCRYEMRRRRPSYPDRRGEIRGAGLFGNQRRQRLANSDTRRKGDYTSSTAELDQGGQGGRFASGPTESDRPGHQLMR